MLRQVSTYRSKISTVNGRILPIKPIHPLSPHPASIHGKKGTLNLEAGGYGLPKNGRKGIIQLHLNENLFLAAQTPKEQISSLLADHLTNLHAYPTAGAQHLQQAIATKLNINT